MALFGRSVRCHMDKTRKAMRSNGGKVEVKDRSSIKTFLGLGDDDGEDGDGLGLSGAEKEKLDAEMRDAGVACASKVALGFSSPPGRLAKHERTARTPSEARDLAVMRDSNDVGDSHDDDGQAGSMDDVDAVMHSIAVAKMAERVE